MNKNVERVDAKLMKARIKLDAARQAAAAAAATAKAARAETKVLQALQTVSELEAEAIRVRAQATLNQL